MATPDYGGLQVTFFFSPSDVVAIWTVYLTVHIRDIALDLNSKYIISVYFFVK